MKIRHWRGITKKIVKTSFFYWLIIALVFGNTVFTAVEHYNQPEWLSTILSITEK